MDVYLSSLLLGGIGLGAMAIGGFSHHGDAGHGHGHGHINHAGHFGDAGHGHAGHAHTHAHVPTHAHTHSHADAHAHGHDLPGPSKAFWILAWPRLAFGFLLGFGTVGLVTKAYLPATLTMIAAAAGGILFQQFVIRPLWNFSLRFASTPALTSESVDEATAVTSFNANGEGLVAIEVDGQVVQVLGQLHPSDRTLGVVVRAGQRLRVNEVNTANNRCTVSAL